jgi:beta-mannosidase
VELSGAWRAHQAEGDLAKVFARPTLDDTSWHPVELPHHWRTVAAFEAFDGPVLYRKRFGAPPPARGRRRFLELDGVFYYGDVWLDGEYVGATEGYFVPHAFEVTAACAARDEHVLALEVSCPPQRDRTAKRTVTGVFGHWDAADPDWNPGGVWRHLRVAETGPVRIARLRVLCTEASVERGRLACDLLLDAGDAPCEGRLRAELRGPAGEPLTEATRVVSLAAGATALSWALAVERPPRWWPHSLGAQPRCTLDLVVEVDGRESDRRTLRTAFREVRRDDWVFRVNGERLFLKGSNHGPTRMALAGASPAEVARDVDLAVDANLDFLRVHAHVARPELYDRADERGLLLWQDFPLQWSYARSVRRQAVRQARAMVDELGHHPSVFLWCAHNAPVAVDREPGAPPRPGAVVKLGVTTVAPTWNKAVLDTAVARAIARRDPTRPVDRHSGTLPGLGDAAGDAHLYYGWYHGTLGDLAPALRRWPRLARFVSELGAQAVPETADWMDPQRWPHLDWARLARHHALQREAFDRFVPPADSKTFDEWRASTQAYQAALLQLQVEDLRRLKYAPAGGFAQFSFADAAPAVGWSVLDHARVPKRGFAALRAACRPVLPMVEPRAGLVHVVNDTRAHLTGAVVEAAVDGAVTRWSGDVPADSVVFVGAVDVAGAVDVEVTLEHETTGRVENRYPLLVLRTTAEGRGTRPATIRHPPEG